MLNETYDFINMFLQAIKLGGDCICLFTIYHKHYWGGGGVMSVKRPQEVTIDHLGNKNKFKVNNNTSETSSVHQKGTGNINTPSEPNSS